MVTPRLTGKERAVQECLTSGEVEWAVCFVCSLVIEPKVIDDVGDFVLFTKTIVWSSRGLYMSTKIEYED